MHTGDGIDPIVAPASVIRCPLLRAARLTGDPRIVSAVAELHPAWRCSYRPRPIRFEDIPREDW